MVENYVTFRMKGNIQAFPAAQPWCCPQCFPANIQIAKCYMCYSIIFSTHPQKESYSTVSPFHHIHSKCDIPYLPAYPRNLPHQIWGFPTPKEGENPTTFSTSKTSRATSKGASPWNGGGVSKRKTWFESLGARATSTFDRLHKERFGLGDSLSECWRVDCFECTPLKFNMEPNNWWFVVVSPFPRGYFQVPCQFSGVYLEMWENNTSFVKDPTGYTWNYNIKYQSVRCYIIF